MPIINIDGKAYELDLLSPKTRDNIRMLRQTDQEIQRLETQLAIVKTARLGYVNAVKQGVETYPRRPGDQVLQ